MSIAIQAVQRHESSPVMLGARQCFAYERKVLAQPLPSRTSQRISWREGTNEILSGRFAAVGSVALATDEREFAYLQE